MLTNVNLQEVEADGSWELQQGWNPNYTTGMTRLLDQKLQQNLKPYKF